MKKLLLFLTLVMIALQAGATPVDESAARQIAQEFFMNALFPDSPPASGCDLRLVHAERSGANVAQNAYYIYNTGSSFIIVAGDDRAEQILGYGDEDIDVDSIPCCMQAMLDSYKEQIDYLLEHPDLVVEKPSMNAPMHTATSVSPMLKTKWHQFAPFYNQTPVYNGRHCKVGCCCIALGQIMYYWKHPTGTVPALPGYTTSSLNISVPALPSTTFDWGNIIVSYNNSYTSAQANATAKLMRYIGQAEHMDYTPTASGAYESGILAAAILFGYDHNAKVLDKDWDHYTDAQWAEIIKAELRAGRPIIYTAVSETTPVAHAFNIDGYTGDSYHIVWGWSGSADGYFKLNAFNSDGGHHFNAYPEMIVGLKPQGPEITADPASLSFNAYTGETKTATFTVGGYALTGDLTVKLNNGGSVFSIDKTNITRYDACFGVKVTVTYKPTTAGTSNASVTISGGGAATKTVPLSGTATNKITVTPSSAVWSSVYAGQTRTRQFTVTVPRAEGDLSVTVSPNDGVYSVDKTIIPKNDAINGATLTASYHPIEAGTTEATITFSGGGISPTAVNLKGTAIRPEITVRPSIMLLSAHPDEVVKRTFVVKGTNLLSDLRLSLNDANGIYSIDKTHISKNNALNGDTVTVTYHPIDAGSSRASITISGGGHNDALEAVPVKLSISGTSLAEITVDPTEMSFDAYVGETKTEYLFIQAPKATGDLTLKLNVGGSTFALERSIADKYCITQSEAINGTTVAVYYHPTSVGNHHAIVTICGGNTETKKVHLYGSALPGITLDTESLVFNTYTGRPMSQSFTVSGTTLNDLTLALDDPSGAYSIDKTCITTDEATGGATVTVTYHPTTDGLHHASVIISGGSAEPITVQLEGKATTPVITTDVSAVNIDPTYTGEQGSGTILITANDLLSDLQLGLSLDFTNSFALSKYTITPEEAAAGALVTVYFNPSTGGKKHARLNINSDGIETVSIPVSGTGIKANGRITAWPSSLSLNTQVGTTVTKRFKVTYSNANGSVMISGVEDNEANDHDEFGSEGQTLNAGHPWHWARTIIPFDNNGSRLERLDSIGPIGPVTPVVMKSLFLELSGDDCFDISPSWILLPRVPYSAYVTVSYHPDSDENHDATITISLCGGTAKPCTVTLHGTVNDVSHKETEGDDEPTTNNAPYGTANMHELSMNSKVYADRLNIVIESPVEQSAIISDVSGRAWRVNLHAGRNEAPVNASGIYMVRIREKTTKLILK